MSERLERSEEAINKRKNEGEGEEESEISEYDNVGRSSVSIVRESAAMKDQLQRIVKIGLIIEK